MSRAYAAFIEYDGIFVSSEPRRSAERLLELVPISQ